MIKSSDTVLLIGSSGQVGQALRARLEGRCALVCAARSGADREIDLTDEKAIRSLVSEVNPALIINAAAYTAVDRAEEEPDIAQAINADAPRILAEEANRLNIPLVHYSTDYVFDGSSTHPWMEDDKPAPLGVYGATKLAGDEAIEAVGGQYLIFRTSWVYAAQGQNFLLTMLRLFAERDSLSIVDDQIGAPTTSAAIADATLQVLEKVDFSTQSGLYNLSCGGEVSWFGFAKAILTRSGLSCELSPIPTSAYPTPACRPLYSALSGARLENQFGVVLPEWNQALDECMAELKTL